MDISNFIQGELGQEIIGSIAPKIGLENEQAQKVLQSALPLFSETLKKNEGNSEQNNGGILDQLSQVASSYNSSEEGSKIVSQLFGNKTEEVQQKIASESNLSTSQISKILPIIAPIIIGILTKGGNGQFNIKSVLDNLLNSSSKEGLNLDSFSSVLDQDGDGKVNSSDIMSAGSKLLGGLFSKKK